MMSQDKMNKKELEKIKQKALEEHIPIIMDDTLEVVDKILKEVKPKRILEIGTAVGYSAMCFSEYLEDGGIIDTIERDEERIAEAKINIKNVGVEDKINIYEGDAVERGTELENVVSYNTQDALSHMCQNVKFGVSAWGKLYKRILFDEIRYPKGKLYEDLLTTPYIFAKANGVVFGDTIQYFWLQRNESIMHRKISEKDLELFDGMDKLIQFIDRNYPDIHDAAICRFANDSFWTIVQRLANSDQYDSMIDNIIRRCKKNWKEALSNKYVPKRKKLNIMMILINKKLYKKIYNLHSENKR